MDHILQEDLEYLSNSEDVSWDKIKGKSILVTGATGLIGSQIVLGLDKYNQLHQGNIRIYALIRNESKARILFEECTEFVNIVIGDIRDSIDIKDEIDYIIHGASMTSSKAFVDFPVETIRTALEGTDNVLEFAKVKKIKSMVYLSSLEVYGVTDPDKKSIRESEYGYIDQLVSRSSYSEGKRMAECLCISYGNEYGVPVKIARLAQTFGPGVSYEDNRVFAQFARSAIEEKDIVLKTKGETYRNYCYTRDAIKGILCVLLKGQNNEAYNIANRETGITICNMAELIAHDIAEDKIKVIFDIADDASRLGYGPTIKVALNTEKLERLGWKAEVDLKSAYERMIQSMRGRK